MNGEDPGTLHHAFTPSANTTGTETVADVGEGAAFLAEKVEVFVTSDPAGDLDVALLNGQELVGPDNELLTVIESDITVRAGTMYDVGDAVELRFLTTGNYTGGEVSVLVHGTAVPEGR